MRSPNGLGNSSGQVGHNLMDHHYGVGATGESDDFADQYILAEEPTAFIFPVSTNINEATKQKDYVRGFGYQGGGSRGRISIERGHWWPVQRRSLTEPGKWGFGIGSWGEHLPFLKTRQR